MSTGRRLEKWRPLAFLVALTALTLLGGCSNFRTYDSPTASVVGVKLVKQTEQASRVEVTVALENPNDVPLPLTKSDYTVELGGRSYSATDVPARTIPAHGRQEVMIPAVVTTAGGGGSGGPGSSYRVDGSITYEPPGEIRKLLTDSYIPLPSVSFTRSGQLD
ncbi:MAG: LEA type 2 family protein [Planctomycetota bacterium]|nr:LEA type 2 family protein [Planctomycetota bacterium]